MYWKSCYLYKELCLGWAPQVTFFDEKIHKRRSLKISEEIVEAMLVDFSGTYC